MTTSHDAESTYLIDTVPVSSIQLESHPVEVVPEGGGWSVFIPGLPVSADGATFDVAIMNMVDALREYAQDWHERLADAPNHRENAPLVELIDSNDDEQLRDWLARAGRP